MNTPALLVVDMQNGFCHPNGSLPSLGFSLAGVADTVANTAAAVRQARSADIPVVFTRHVYRPGRADEGRKLSEASAQLAAVDGLAAGSWDGDVIDELAATPNDLYVDKVRFDAFLWTSLDPLLQGLGVTDLIVCGVVTNVCVESTVRAGFMRDYPITLLEDCCASRTTRLHEIGIEAMRDLGFASIASVSAGFALASTREPSPAAA